MTWAGEMPQSVECLSYKQEDLSLTPRTHMKKQELAALTAEGGGKVVRMCWEVRPAWVTGDASTTLSEELWHWTGKAGDGPVYHPFSRCEKVLECVEAGSQAVNPFINSFTLSFTLSGGCCAGCGAGCGEQIQRWCPPHGSSSLKNQTRPLYTSNDSSVCKSTAV